MPFASGSTRAPWTAVICSGIGNTIPAGTATSSANAPGRCIPNTCRLRQRWVSPRAHRSHLPQWTNELTTTGHPPAGPRPPPPTPRRSRQTRAPSPAAALAARIAPQSSPAPTRRCRTPPLAPAPRPAPGGRRRMFVRSSPHTVGRAVFHRNLLSLRSCHAELDLDEDRHRRSGRLDRGAAAPLVKKRAVHLVHRLKSPVCSRYTFVSTTSGCCSQLAQGSPDIPKHLLRLGRNAAFHLLPGRRVRRPCPATSTNSQRLPPAKYGPTGCGALSVRTICFIFPSCGPIKPATSRVLLDQKQLLPGSAARVPIGLLHHPAIDQHPGNTRRIPIRLLVHHAIRHRGRIKQHQIGRHARLHEAAVSQTHPLGGSTRSS